MYKELREWIREIKIIDKFPLRGYFTGLCDHMTRLFVQFFDPMA